MNEPITFFKTNTIYTDSTNISLSVPHEKSYQKIKVDGSDVDLKQQTTPLELDTKLAKLISREGANETKLHEIISNQNDFSINGDGVFAFSPDNYFNPFPKNTVQFEEGTSLDQIDYIFAKYKNPQQKEGWLYQEAEYDLSSYNFGNNTLSFVLLVPHSSASTTQGALFRLQSLEITLE